MNKTYETMVIFDGSLPEETIRKESQTLEDLLRESSSFEKTIPWGKRNLEFEIKKKRSGAYFIYQYSGEGEVPAKIDEHFSLNTSVLRYMTIVRDPKKRTLAQVNAEKAAAQQAEEDKAKTETAKETAAEEPAKPAEKEPASPAPAAGTETAKEPAPETEAGEERKEGEE